MRDTKSFLKVAAFSAAATLAGQAMAMPWDTDMADSDAVKAYERIMMPLPEGVMSQPHLLTPISYRAVSPWIVDGALTTATASMSNPLDASADVLAQGERMYNVYCTPCHGNGVELGPVSERGYPAIAVLAGDKGRLQNQTDGHVYLTIFNGSMSGLMPGYSYAMTEQEMWSIVSYMRHSLPNAAAPAPVAPAAEEGEEADQ